MSIALRRIDHHGARAVRDLLVDLYTDVYTGDPVSDPDAFAERLARQTASPGWTCVLGYDGGTPVGYAYGLPLPPDTDWWARTAPHLDADVTRETGTRTFTVAELGVQRPWRGTGTARLLHDALCADRREGRTVLRVLTNRTGLLALYESWGYQHLPAPSGSVTSRACAMLRPGV